MKKYVKLRDRGTIFHDASQDVAVTGTIPTEIKTTKKVNAALKGGILIEVSEKDAKIAIAEAAGNKKEAVRALNLSSDTKVAKVQEELDAATSIISKKDEKIAELEQTIKDAEIAKAQAGVGELVPKADYDKVVSELETSKLGRINPEAHKKVVDNLAEANKSNGEKDTEIAKLVKDLTASKAALADTKTALAEATKKSK